MKRTKYRASWFLLGITLGALLIFLIGCDENAFEFETQLPKVEIELLDENVAIQYKLGDLLILDEWESLNAGQIMFLLNKEKEKQVLLKVTAADFNGVKFIYLINGTIEVETKPIEWKLIARHIESFPNVIWTTKDGKCIPKEEQKTEVGDKKNPIQPKKLGGNL